MTRKELEERRLKAAASIEEGMTARGIARKHGVSKTTASNWRKRYRENPGTGLQGRKATGRPAKLASGQLALLKELLCELPATSRWWTCTAVAQLIEETFRVRYSSAHVCKLIHAHGLLPLRKKQTNE